MEITVAESGEGLGLGAPTQSSDFIPNQIYTRAEVAETLGISSMTLIRAERKGLLRSYKAGRKIRYTGRMVKAWLERDRSEE